MLRDIKAKLDEELSAAVLPAQVQARVDALFAEAIDQLQQAASAEPPE